MAMTVGELNVEIGAKLDKLDRALNEMDRKMRSTAKKTESTWQKWGKKIGGVLAATFAASAIMNVGKEIFRVTAEFQKMGAVLSNTLGSQSKANMAMNDIKNFAAETPFSVRELTNSFVKLANQGFQPTMEQMRLMGDVASSTGKSFDQLTEAIIDAQTGEFERLKEFGIRAQKSGDQVTFTFKGIQTQVDFTSESIQQYILGLGELEGVQGANSKISQTLGGKFSNLGDALDNLYNTIGSGTSGPLMDLMDWSTDMIANLNGVLQLFTDLDTKLKNFNVALDLFTNDGKKTNQVFKLLENSTGETISNYEKLNIALYGFTDAQIKLAEEQRKLEKTQKDWIAEVQKGTTVLEQDATPAIFNFQKSMEDLYGKVPEETEEVEEKVRDFTDATLEQLEAMRDMGKMANLTEDELANLEKRLKAIYDLRGATRAAISFSLSPDQRETTDGTDIDAGRDYEDEIDSAIASANAFTEANKGLLEKLQQNREAVFQLASTISGTLGNAFASAMVNMKNFGQIMLDTLKGILQQLIAVVAQAAILAVIMNIINPGSATFKGAFKTILGFSGGLEGRASGGPVNFGQAYLVGERGPELFMPGRSGSIMPNNKLGMMGATVAVGGRLLGQDILISNARSQQGLSRQTGR